jgi:hypothetical protein
MLIPFTTGLLAGAIPKLRTVNDAMRAKDAIGYGRRSMGLTVPELLEPLPDQNCP